MEHGALLAERYEVLERLGRGGMGEVWSAHDRSLRRRVALKLLPLGEAAPDDFAARFEREAVAAAQINHPNVVALHDRGVHGDTLFLVMELVDGMSLSALINASGALTCARAVEIAEQVCTALEATHEAGVVHFDIKPQNVMITRAGAAKVVDFGIAGLVQAKQLSVVHSSKLAPAATLEYAAPEQVTAGHGDARSDLYALGGVLFAMLTGRAPFTGPTAWAVMAAKISGEAPRLEQARPGLPPQLNDLVAQLLEREPELRPRSAREVRERLADIRSGDTDERAPLPGTTTLDAPVPPAVTAERTLSSGPRQLPTDTRLFTGRENELDALFALAEQARAGGEPGTVVISAIDGMGGVGKTALAIRAAHRLAPRFPDGQLFLDLYGYTQGTAPRDPSEALAALLGSLGISPRDIPADLDARAAAYRDRLAGTRTLIVLDNVADEAQVIPLLPACETCLVLVTSRKRLKALDDALPLALDVLPRDEAVTLLRKAARLGTDAEDELLERAAELCGYLPLALLIAGALLRTGGPGWNLSVLIERLESRPAGHELAGYTDEIRSVQAVFDLSYQNLPEDVQVLFRRLGLLPGPEIDAYAAAASLDGDPDTAARLLQRLTDHSLLIAVTPGRYRPHDLVRAHARTLAVSQDPEPVRRAACDRLLHYYAYTAQAATKLIARNPRHDQTDPAPAHQPDALTTDTARAWLRVELANLDAAFAYASSHDDLGDHAVALAAGLAETLLVDGPFTRAIDVHRTAADIAERAGHEAAQANALTELGRAQSSNDDYPGAEAAYTQSLEIHRRLGDELGQANALSGLGRVQYITGGYSTAEATHDHALRVYRDIGYRLGEANALNDLGRVRYVAGDFPGAEDVLAQALEIYQAVGNRSGEAGALTDLGLVRHLTGDFPGAEDVLAQSLTVYRDLGNRLGEAGALNDLGLVRSVTGNYAGAKDVLDQALVIYRALSNRLGEATTLTDLAKVRSATGDLDGAEAALSRALEIYRALGHLGGEANALTSLGRARLAAGDHAGAVEAQASALEIFRGTGERGNEAVVLNYYAAAIAASGDRARAFELYRQALAMNRELDKPDDEAISLEGLAELHLADGDAELGGTLLNQALEIFRRLGMSADIERAETRVAELATGVSGT
ncbi:MAG TPA: tetratricopeptide repeat protein [Actinospica sp.]|jgi:tetratricopeptide (TPR) repeat protein|nr:tetratricopeptide repeat protein [Actinospica sp.]